jgi:hypothetical protein
LNDSPCSDREKSSPVFFDIRINQPFIPAIVSKKPAPSGLLAIKKGDFFDACNEHG